MHTACIQKLSLKTSCQDFWNFVMSQQSSQRPQPCPKPCPPSNLVGFGFSKCLTEICYRLTASLLIGWLTCWWHWKSVKYGTFNVFLSFKSTLTLIYLYKNSIVSLTKMKADMFSMIDYYVIDLCPCNVTFKMKRMCEQCKIEDFW